MAHRFISSAIGLNESLQSSLTCCIHQGLLERPIVLPAPCTHRFCTECISRYLQANGTATLTCPQCKVLHPVPSTWNTDWFDRVLNSVTTDVATSRSEISKKVTDFVERSYAQFNQPQGRLIITSVMQLYNPILKERFEQCKRLLQCNEVVTLFHGTDRQSAFSIGGQGFSIPTSFERNQKNNSEGELKFGKAIYFAHAKKASEYGKNTFVLTDCILGRTQSTDMSELKLTPDIVHGRGYDTIYYNNNNEGLVNQEWAIYRSEQCFPLCIIEYEIFDESSEVEVSITSAIQTMDLKSPDYHVLTSALLGTDNQCKAVLKLIGDGGSKELSQATTVMCTLLNMLDKSDVVALFQRSNETVRILLLRALWQTGRRHDSLQWVIHDRVEWSLLIEALNSSYADVSWRACGVLTNMAAHVKEVRRLLAATEILDQLMTLLQRAIGFHDKICMLTVLNLFANIAATEYNVMKSAKKILIYLNEHILDHHDKEIQESGNRLFSNIISKGTITTDWQKNGYKSSVSAPSMEPKTKK